MLLNGEKNVKNKKHRKINYVVIFPLFLNPIFEIIVVESNKNTFYHKFKSLREFFIRFILF